MNAIPIKDKKLLYHLTSLENLNSIISNGLLSRNMLLSNMVNFNDIADQNILEKRKEHHLANYVPFHFFPNNPFDYTVRVNNPNTEFIYICLHRDVAKKNGALIISQHPLTEKTPFIYSFDDGMNAIDWKTMEQKNYIDSSQKSICLAEVLYPEKVPTNLFQSIVVESSSTQTKVRKILRQYKINSIFVDKRKKYFYKPN